jgi:flagellar biosynthesis protein FlhF
MEVRKFTASNMKAALEKVKVELGPDALILSNQSVSNGVEVTASISRPKKKENPEPEQNVKQSTISKIFNKTKKETVTIQPDDGLQILLKNIKKDIHLQMKNIENMSWYLESQKNSDPIFLVREDFNNEEISTNRYSKQYEIQLASLKGEVSVLRSIVNQNSEAVRWSNLNQELPMQAYLIQQLCKMGISHDISKLLVDEVKDYRELNIGWLECLKKLQNKLKTRTFDKINCQGVFTFVGPTGSGKTTSLMKLATSLIHKTHVELYIVNFDFLKIGTKEQLSVFCKLAKIRLFEFNSIQDFEDFCSSNKDKCILVDLPGFQQEGMEFYQNIFLNESIIKFFVLAASSQVECLSWFYQNFYRSEKDSIILTKIDESVLLGEPLSEIILNNLPISFVSDGASIPEDLNMADAKSLINQTLYLGRKNNLDESLIVDYFSKL